ncbi:MAG TPA: DUF6600 domain-containing protein [Thermoanaerobaculia bacterium]|nr:DUF6600 domain-containing protein [Thermoanaerobaculia bacterium]
MKASWTRTLARLAAAVTLLLPVSTVFGQERDEYGDAALSDVAQTVARISNLQGNASYARGDQPDNWQPADVNVPMTNGDRVYTDRHTRLELQIEGGDAVRVGGQTDLVALNLTDDTRQFALKTGVASFQVHQLDSNDVFEVDTPNAAVTFESAGDYRFDIDQDGNTRLSVRRGRASVAAGGGEVPLQSGEAMLIDGGDNPRYDVVSMRSPDGWDQWVDERAGRYTRSASYRYVNQSIPGADDLDQYGQWQQIPNQGWAWSPTSIDAGWSPYRIGHWAWQDPWGWTWISSEPWGWAPYHYGRWTNYSSRWYWIPAAPVARVAYAPACVAFVGGSPGLSVAVTAGPAAFVGWFPLGPSEAIVPWWSTRSVNQVNVTNITYVNKTYVTVVNQNTFVSAQPVARSIVTDRTVVQQVAAAPIVRGRVPFAPTVASTRVSLRTETSVARPPAAVVQRAVVARVAPPPAPPRFDQKLAAIRQSGTPIAPNQGARIAVQERAQPAAAVAVKPVSAESGRVTFAPRTAAAGTTAPGATAPRPAPTPRPITAAVAGRAIATREQPVANAPVAGPRAMRAPAGRETQNPPAETRNAPAAAAPVAPAPARPETQPVRPQSESREIQRPTPARPQVEPRNEPRPAAPVERPQNEPQDQRRAATPDWRNRSTSTERSQEVPPPNQPQRRVVTPPEARPEPPNRTQNESRQVEPRRAAPTARPEAEPRSREEVRPTPSRENARSQPEERAAPPERSSRENPDGNEREAPRRPTAHPRPTPEKPER